MRDLESTIVAIASSHALRAVPSRGIVRASGPAALTVLGSCVARRCEAPGSTGEPAAQPGQASGPSLGARRPPPGSTRRGIDSALLRLGDADLPVLALRFPAPRSFTGEDVLEIQAPGSPALLERIVATLIEVGTGSGAAVRHAEPGEFSARAFLYGRISIDEAEGIAAAIAARGDGELRAARRLMEGRLGRRAGAWSERLVGLLALIEAGIDFTDQEDVIAISASALAEALASIRTEIEEELRSTRPAERRGGLPRVVLTGPPNAGKSSLFNALLGADRSIVAAIAGTTRDAIEMPLTLERDGRSIEVLLVDVPGVEAEGGGHDVRTASTGGLPFELLAALESAARDAIERADLLLRCIPADTTSADPGGGPARAEAALPLAARILNITTRADLAPERGAATPGIRTSSVTGEGLAALREAIATAIDECDPTDVDVMSLDQRHREALGSAARELARLLDALEDEGATGGAPSDLELVAERLRSAVDALGAVSGRIVADDVLEVVFRRFCIGK